MLIYEPSGKAREYSPLALNIYLGCTHECLYCYAPRVRHQKPEDYYAPPNPRNDIAKKLDAELSKRPPVRNQVLLSFIGDAYCEAIDQNEATRNCLEVLLHHHVPVAILTKGGSRCLKDIDIFKKFGEHIQIGTTLTFDNDADSLYWEKGAALPDERLEMLKVLHENGVKTFASFEPVIDIKQSLALMKKGLDCINVFKVGKLNSYKGLDKTMNWEFFLKKTVDLLRAHNKKFYIKYDLREAAKSVHLSEDEINPDLYNVK